MKVKPGAIAKLQQQLAERSAASCLTYSKIGDLSDVHPSHVSRICRGEFKTLSQNVVQVCIALEIPIEGLSEASGYSPIAAQLTEGVLSVWKGTPEDAQLITKLLDQLKEFREPAL